MGIEVTSHLAGMTYCVYVKGIASGGAFVDEYCRQQYLVRLFNALKPYQVKLHAYTVLENEAYLLMTPQSSSGLSSVMNAIQKSFGEYYQNRFERCSSPLSKNILASAVSGYKLTLDCQKLIERLAVDAGLSNIVGLWQWSSYTANGFGCTPWYLSKHKHCLSFMASSLRAYPSYREFIASPLEPRYRDYLLARIRSGNTITKKTPGRVGIVATKTVSCEPGVRNCLALG